MWKRHCLWWGAPTKFIPVIDSDLSLYNTSCDMRHVFKVNSENLYYIYTNCQAFGSGIFTTILMETLIPLPQIHSWQLIFAPWTEICATWYFFRFLLKTVLEHILMGEGEGAMKKRRCYPFNNLRSRGRDSDTKPFRMQFERSTNCATARAKKTFQRSPFISNLVLWSSLENCEMASPLTSNINHR